MSALTNTEVSPKGKRKQMTLGKEDDLSLADTRIEPALKLKFHHEGLDPRIEKKRTEYSSMMKGCVSLAELEHR